MTRKKNIDSPFSKFFKEDSQDFISKSTKEEELISYAQKKIPFIPKTELVDEIELKERWKSLRKFFISSIDGKLPKDVTPVHLNPHFLSDGILLNYPVWIENADKQTVKAESENKCLPLNNILSEHISSLYPDPGQGKMIKQVLPRIVMEAGNVLQLNGVQDFQEVFEKVYAALMDKMELRGGDKEIFEEQISELKSNIHTQGELYPYSSYVTFEILHAALSNVSSRSKQEFLSKIHKILHRLIDILKVDSENEPESSNPEHLESSMDFAGTYLDFDRLSKVIPESASEHISKERHHRIKSVIESLTRSEELFSINATVIVQNHMIKSSDSRLKEIFSDSEFIEVNINTCCTDAISIYNAKLSEFTNTIKALRIGELEMESKYIPEIHDEAFSSFDNYSFTEEEVSFFPPVIMIAHSSDLVDEELSGFSQILHRSIPINVVALRSIREDISDNAVDIVSLAVSYRNTFVTQLTSLDPRLLFEKFKEGVATFSPSLFHIEIAQNKSDKEGLIELSASIESRDFPEFVYNGKVGTAWGSRFDIKDNPQNKLDWPVHEYACKDASGMDISLSIPFSFADFAALKPKYQSEFMIIEPEIWTEDLILLSDYLTLSEKDRYGKIPFIWMTDGESMMRVAVSWKLVMVAGEKKDFWNYLQDCGGVHSYHAKKAVQDQEQKIRIETDEEIARLKEEHAAELQKVKEESAKDAMEHLTSALLDIDIDTDAIVSGQAKSETPSPLEQQPVQESDIENVIIEDEIQDEPEEELISEEPWIETPLCTACNECTDINNRMFNYNADKLAFIADPGAGSFAQLVEAAEKCPVKIIHPGKPLNPDEPGLEDLIKRASKFN